MIKIPDFVYPKDYDGNALCPRCKKLITQCDCPSGESKKLKSLPIRPSIHLDKSGRRGKVVTCIGNLPNNEDYLKDLSKKLKIKTGSGGTFYLKESAGTIELQGDHQKLLIEYFKRTN